MDAINRVAGGFESINHRKLAAALSRYIGNLDADEKRLDMSRALFRSEVLGGAANSNTSVQLVSDFIRLTEDFYHQQDYENAVKYGRVAVERSPSNIYARTFYVRALVKSERFDDAEAQIEDIRRLGALKDSYFLTGFMERRREHIPAAINAFEEAVRRGRRGIAVHRELADCYFRDNNLRKARQHIDLAQHRTPDNRYVVDLQIQIATHQRDADTARNRLEILKIVDHRAFYLHRLSTVEYSFGGIVSAYNAAVEAFECHERPTLAMVSQLIKCEIETGRSEDAARHILYLESRFSHVKHDIKIGLKCKWEMSQQQFENADALWQQLKDKNRPVHRALRRDVLKGLVEAMREGDSRREVLENEIGQLDLELQYMDASVWDFEVEDD